MKDCPLSINELSLEVKNAHLQEYFEKAFQEPEEDEQDDAPTADDEDFAQEVFNIYQNLSPSPYKPESSSGSVKAGENDGYPGAPSWLKDFQKTQG